MRYSYGVEVESIGIVDSIDATLAFYDDHFQAQSNSNIDVKSVTSEKQAKYILFQNLPRTQTFGFEISANWELNISEKVN